MYDSLINLFGQLLLPFLGIALVFTLCMRFYENRRRLLHRESYELAGKHVLITGASSGLGSALAAEFYAGGAKVILASRSLDKLRILRESLKSTPTNRLVTLLDPIVSFLDLADSSTIEAAVSEILKMTGGRLDVLVNNAGMSMRGSCLETSMDVHRQLMDVNYFGHVQLTQLLLKPMLETAAKNPTSSSPCIICISSVQGRIAIPYRSAYAASKHAFQAYFDSLRAELAGQKQKERVRVFVISPGYIRTNLSVNALTGAGDKYGRLDETTAGGMTAEVAAKFIIDGLLDGSEELILAPMDTKLGIAIRTLFPGLYFWMMAKRAAKVQKA